MLVFDVVCCCCLGCSICCFGIVDLFGWFLVVLC